MTRWSFVDGIARRTVQYMNASLKDYLPLVQKNDNKTVPIGYHFAYFVKDSGENELSSDGYESYQAPAGYPYRFWTGGVLRFKKPLQVETVSECAEWVDKESKDDEKCSVKIMRQMREMEKDWSIEEERNLIYFKNRVMANKMLKPPANWQNQLTIKPSDILLFRYSALTFNSHRIHWDRKYTQGVEKLEDLVVHGPLTVTLMLQYIQSVHSTMEISEFSYKNLSPLYVNRNMTLNIGSINNNTNNVKVWITNDKGSMAFTGTVKFFSLSANSSNNPE